MRIRWALDITGVFIKWGNKDTDTHPGKMPCEEGGRDHADPAEAKEH